MALTLREYLARKKYKEEKIQKILLIFTELWQQTHGVNDKRIRLMEFLKKVKRLEKCERLFAKEFGLYDALHNMWKLKSDPSWPIVNEEVERMKKTKLCPYCGVIMKKHGMVSYLCSLCNKIFNLGKDDE